MVRRDLVGAADRAVERVGEGGADGLVARGAGAVAEAHFPRVGRVRASGGRDGGVELAGFLHLLAEEMRSCGERGGFEFARLLGDFARDFVTLLLLECERFESASLSVGVTHVLGLMMLWLRMICFLLLLFIVIVAARSCVG